MPFLTGGTLKTRLSRGPLSIAETTSLISGLARALGRAHRLGIVHRDVKPDNVLFDAEGRPHLSDLGIAMHFAPGVDAQSLALTKVGAFLGTVGYMAPEQLE